MTQPATNRDLARRAGTQLRPFSGKTSDVDVLIEEAGAISLFHLVTERAEAWTGLRPDRTWYTLVGALVVECSYTEAFARWMRAEGLNVGLAAPRGRV